ncbi:hypothetical protein L6164_020314 [Bauhinia variegata]|uniref:Uncharacterized protein n=1 Tax=Bauhinia variegata TaxID=167791 RepID=A0ACB9MZF5_BAUVA|nr:hypothetical protein L6164_020314 [Bauhinia variegata]
MASESGVKCPSSSSSNAAESYIGSFISLISKYEIRYEGVLYFLNVQDSTIGLKNVRSYGTEGRRKDGPQVPPSEKVYEYILFRGNDIKDLQVKSPSSSSKAEEQTYSDPAIIQSQYSGVPLCSPSHSVGGRSAADSIQRHDTPAATSRALTVGLPSHQAVTQVGPADQTAITQVAGHPSFSTSMYWQGHSGLSSNSSHSLPRSSSFQSPSTLPPVMHMQNKVQTPENGAPKSGRTTLLEHGIPTSSATVSGPVNPARSPSPTSLQISDSLDITSLLSTKTPMPYPVSMTSSGSNVFSFSSSFQDINSSEGQISGKISPDMRSFFPAHTVHHSASFVDSTSSPLLASPSLLTLDQFAQPRSHFFPLAQNPAPDHRDMGPLTLASSSSSVVVPSSASKAPLLPLPTSVQKPQYSAAQFTEEFDFEAMNEKFKKDEVWSSLGKATEKIEGVVDNVSAYSLGHREGQGMTPNLQPAYKKDDFFDTISCNSLARGSRNAQNRLSERIRLDTETFGNFQQRPHIIGYGAYGAGRGENHRGSYNWGRGYGYGYGGRGRGGNLPF